jgi:hypothetical protein
VLVLDKNNSVEHLVRFKKLQDKVKNIQSRQNLMTRKERRETFLTIPFGGVVAVYTLGVAGIVVVIEQMDITPMLREGGGDD